MIFSMNNLYVHYVGNLFSIVDFKHLSPFTKEVIHKTIRTNCIRTLGSRTEKIFALLPPAGSDKTICHQVKINLTILANEKLLVVAKEKVENS